mgnify:FL=1
MADLNDIAAFTAVARALSFTKAARTLQMPKSTVSERVSRLEARLGVRLLERTTRSLRLTPSGAAYFAQVGRIVHELEEAEAAVTAAHKTPRGVLRIGCPLLFAQSFLSDVVATYLSRYPEAQVELVVADRPFEIVEEALDVAIHVVGPIDAQLVARKLGIGGRVCVASPAYVEKHGRPGRPLDLAEHACLVNGPTRSMTWTFEREGEAQPVVVNARYAVTSFELVYRATLAGLGYATLPAFLCVNDIESGRLIRVLDDWSAGETTLHLVYPSHRHLAARVRAFVDLVVERLPSFPSGHFAAPPVKPRTLGASGPIGH